MPVLTRSHLRIRRQLEARAKQRHTAAHRRLQDARRRDVHPRQQLVDARDAAAKLLDKRRAQVAEAERAVRRRAKPQLITARQLGLRVQYVWGAKGPLDSVAGHYDAGTKVHSDAELIARVRSIHRGHLNLGHGGIAYEAVVAGRTIVLANPMNRKSAAVANQNTGLASICVPGTAGDRMDDETRETVQWLIANWHTRAIPAEHRLPRPARSVPRLGHKEFPGQSTQCPDLYLIDYRKAWA